MGDITEMILDGELCEECGGYIDGKAPGYPRKCNDCKGGGDEEQIAALNRR